MANRRGKGGSNGRFPLLRLCSHCEWWLQSHEMRMWLLLVRKAMTNLDSVLKNRDITLQKKSYCQDCGLPSSHIQLWELDCKEGQRIGAFKLWCWRRLLKVSWIARISSQSIPREINLEYSLEGLTLKLQYFGHLIWTASCLWRWERLRAEGEERVRG